MIYGIALSYKNTFLIDILVIVDGKLISTKCW